MLQAPVIEGLSFDPTSFQFDRFSAIRGGPKGISNAGRFGRALGGAGVASWLKLAVRTMVWVGPLWLQLQMFRFKIFVCCFLRPSGGD